MIEKLGFSAQYDGGFFVDDRRGTTRRGRRLSRQRIVAYLNKSKYNAGFYLKINRPDIFKVQTSIPKSITDLNDAVDWVFANSRWVTK